MRVKTQVKFIFYLKSGKTFETITTTDRDELLIITSFIKKCLSEDTPGSVKLGDCVVRLSDVSVADWEELE